LSWFLDSRLPQAFAINLSIENFLVSGSYCQSDKEGVFVKPLSCIASGVLLNPNSGYSHFYLLFGQSTSTAFLCGLTNAISEDLLVTLQGQLIEFKRSRSLLNA
jgi:hypothetical protein